MTGSVIRARKDATKRDGMILGSNVWHYTPSLAPAYTNATLITLSLAQRAARLTKVVDALIAGQNRRTSAPPNLIIDTGPSHFYPRIASVA